MVLLDYKTPVTLIAISSVAIYLIPEEMMFLSVWPAPYREGLWQTVQGVLTNFAFIYTPCIWNSDFSMVLMYSLLSTVINFGPSPNHKQVFCNFFQKYFFHFSTFTKLKSKYYLKIYGAKKRQKNHSRYF